MIRMKPPFAVLGILFATVVVILMLERFVPWPWPKKTGAKPAFSEICVGKVVYLQFGNAVVTKVRPDGKIWTCGGV